MPRPKRTKVASTNTRVAKPAPPKTQAKVITTSRTAIETLNSFSDDSDGLVVKATSTRTRRKMAWQKTPEPVGEAELIMTGALPPAAASSSSAMTRSAKSSSKFENIPRSTRPARRKSSSAAITAQATIVEQLPEDLESSGFGDLTFSSLGSESPAHGTRPPSAIKVGATPAHEASLFAITNFKRRPRQPSLLRMVQQTTDVEDNGSDLDDTSNLDFDDFLPEAESTPLNLRKNPAEDETRNDSGAQVSSSGSRGVKRKLSPVIQVPRSSPPYDPPSGRDVESLRSTSPSLPDVIPTQEELIEQTPQEEEPLSQTYAPPMSSSPVREAPPRAQSPERRSTRQRGRFTRGEPQDDDSDGEETETPAKAKRTTRVKPKQAISTVQLKGLLPRRRHYKLRDLDELDLESSEVTTFDSDQDELQLPAPRTRQRPGAEKSASPKAAKKTARGRNAPARPSKTYSRRISSDKENNMSSADAEGPTEVSAVEHSERLAAIRKKFEEVDKYELEFETVDVTTSSSPFR